MFLIFTGIFVYYVGCLVPLLLFLLSSHRFLAILHPFEVGIVPEHKNEMWRIYLNVYKMTEIRKSKMGKWTTLTHQNWTTKDQKNSPRPPQSPDLRAAEQLWDVVELEVCISSWQICKCDTIMSMQSKISQKCFHIKAALNPGLPGCT